MNQVAKLKGKKVVTYSDGGSRGNPGPSAIGVVLASPSGEVLYEFGSVIGNGTNNQAEYQALLKALELAHNLDAREVRCVMDSQLAVEQLCGRYKVKNAGLQDLIQQVRRVEKKFRAITFEHVRRSHPMITRADALVNQALDRAKSAAHKGSKLQPVQGELF